MHTGSFRYLGVLHNAGNIIHISKLVEQLRAEGHAADDATLVIDHAMYRLSGIVRYPGALADTRR